LKALIVADGDVPSRAAVDQLLGGEPADLVIAADGGALKALALGFAPDVVVGDSDSIGAADVERLREGGAEINVYPTHKDESDTELALREARDRGATSLLVIGAFGGARLEHTIANLLLLASAALVDCDVVLADERCEVRLVSSGRVLPLHGEPGDFVSIFPLTPVADGVDTDGLEYPLTGEQLVQGPARGLSNVMTGAQATVGVKDGRLLVVHTRLEQ
jgi:thiamine pyrophosphokinase